MADQTYTPHPNGQGIKKYDANIGRQVIFTAPVQGDRWNRLQWRYNTLAPEGTTGTVTGYHMTTHGGSRYCVYHIRLDVPGSPEVNRPHDDLADRLGIEWVRKPRKAAADK